MEEVGLRLHPQKTRIVYCRDGRRRAEHEHTSFTFLGYASRARGARSKNSGNLAGFLPAISPDALRSKGAELRRMRIHRRTDLSLDDLARWLDSIVAGWINYYGRYYRTALNPLLQRVNAYLRRWAGRKYGRLRAHRRFQVVDRAAHKAARAVRSLARGPHVLRLIRRARRRETVMPGSVGAGGCDAPSDPTTSAAGAVTSRPRPHRSHPLGRGFEFVGAGCCRAKTETRSPLTCLEEPSPKGDRNERHRRVPEEQRGLCRGL
jgi:Group II intron, maturase-specific domain